MKDPARQIMHFHFFFTDKQIDTIPDETHGKNDNFLLNKVKMKQKKRRKKKRFGQATEARHLFIY